jgi:predicted transcriptional regulator
MTMIGLIAGEDLKAGQRLQMGFDGQLYSLAAGNPFCVGTALWDIAEGEIVHFDPEIGRFGLPWPEIATGSGPEPERPKSWRERPPML